MLCAQKHVCHVSGDIQEVYRMSPSQKKYIGGDPSGRIGDVKSNNGFPWISAQPLLEPLR